MNWQDYFDACNDNDIWKAFSALAGVGVLPVVNGADKHGKIKRPLAAKDEAWQHISTEEWSDRFARFLQQGVPVGVGCKPVGHLVIDVDPKDKDVSNLTTAWAETSQAIFGTDDPPRTLTIRTEAGAHIWFVLNDATAKAWADKGKRTINLPSGGKAELYVGVPNGGYQVACAPSEGKTIAIATPPIELPAQAAKAIDAATTKEIRPPTSAPVSHVAIAKPADDLQWAMHVLDSGYLDSELDDYETWLRVGMALTDRFPLEGPNLWEAWSARNHKHIDQECYSKVKSFKRGGGNVARFGTIVAIVRRNGGPLPPRLENAIPPRFENAVPSEPVHLTPDIEAADCDTIFALMKDREWVWGNTENNTGWFVKRGLHLVEGKEGTGKTRWMLDLVRRWSLDIEWPDGSPNRMPLDAKMLFVASDSHFDQIAMTSRAFGIDPKQIIFTGPENDPYSFTSLDDPATLDLIRHWCTKYKVGMIVIDTLMAATARPLVDPQEVAQVAAPLRSIARELDVAIVLVGHLNSQGETWGRAMGRQCDNVIRMEADERDEQRISIRSVKARWNRFLLPVINGRQGEAGWDYDMPNAEDGNVRVKTKKDRVKLAILAYVRQYPNSTKSMIVRQCEDQGYSKSLAYDAIEELEISEQLLKFDEKTFSGSTIPRYRTDFTKQ